MNRYSKTLLRTGAAKKRGALPQARAKGEMTIEEEAALLGEPPPASQPPPGRNSVSDVPAEARAVLPPR